MSPFRVCLTATLLGLAWMAPDCRPGILAGEVTAVVDEGVLHLTGSPDPDVLQVTAFGNRLVVSARGQTRFPSEGRRNSRLLTFSNVTGITFDGDEGDDSLTVFATLETFEFVGGPGNNRLNAAIGPVTGATVDAGEGNNVVVLAADGAAAVTIALGASNDALTVSTSAIGELSITDSGGNDTVLLNQITGLPDIGILLSVLLDEGDDQLVFQGCHIVSPDPMLPAVLDGGEEGFDQVGQLESTFEPFPLITEFEEVVGFDPPEPPPIHKPAGRRGR